MIFPSSISSASTKSENSSTAKRTNLIERNSLLARRINGRGRFQAVLKLIQNKYLPSSHSYPSQFPHSHAGHLVPQFLVHQLRKALSVFKLVGGAMILLKAKATPFSPLQKLMKDSQSSLSPMICSLFDVQSGIVISVY